MEEPSTKAFKFLHAVDTRHIDNEQTVRISRLSYYRKLCETTGGDDRIGDELEGSSQIVHDQFSGHKASAKQVRIAEAMGVRGLQNVGGFSFYGNRVIETTPEDPFVYCFSVGPIKDLIQVFKKKENGSYNACYVILDILGFVELLLSGVIVEHQLQPARQVLLAKLGRVTYEPRTADISREKGLSPSPFKKDLRFAEQSESRIVLTPTMPLAIERATIKVNGLSEVLARVF